MDIYVKSLIKFLIKEVSKEIRFDIEAELIFKLLPKLNKSLPLNSRYRNLISTDRRKRIDNFSMVIVFIGKIPYYDSEIYKI